jgi:pyruvate dehydrogenase E1 component
MSENFEAPDLNIEQLVDTDPTESAEWRASFDAALKAAGPVRARYLMLNLLQHAREKNVGISALRTTDYINTIAPEHEAKFPGDEDLERKIRRINRWNAAMLVHRAQRPGVGVGGHISTYASSDRTTQVVEIRFSSKVTQVPECMHVHF